MYPLINVRGIDSRRRLNLLQVDRVVLIWPCFILLGQVVISFFIFFVISFCELLSALIYFSKNFSFDSY